MIFWKNIYSRTYANPDRGRIYNGFRLACSSKSNTAKTYYKVGDYYNDGTKEGVVFEVSADGKHGKIVSMKQSGNLQWSSDSAERKRLIGASSQTDGAYNMAKVKAIPGWETKYPAFKWCADFGEGWYLPSIGELRTIFKSKEKLNPKLTNKLVGAYYSSTELGQYQDYAWLDNMDTGWGFSHNKGSYYSVRAVAKF